LLAAHVLGPHVDHALEAEKSADGSGGDAMLSGARFGDDATLAHALGEQGLAQAVIDFVRAGVEEVFALQINPGAAKFPGQTSGVSAQQFLKSELKLPVARGLRIFALKLVEGGHQGFRNIASAVWAEAAGLRGELWSRHGIRVDSG